VDDILDRAGRHADSVDKLLQTQPDSNPDVVKQTTFAMEEIDRALEVDPRSARAYFLRGRVHALLLQRDEARRCYGKAIELGPVALALLERANLDCQELIYLKGDPATAASPSIQSLRESVRRDLDQLKRLKTDAAHLEFAQALEQVTRLDQEGFRSAAEILESYVSRNRDWRAFIWKGTCEAECGEFDKARVSYEAALGFRRRSRAGAWILDRLGLMFVLKDQMDEAEKHLREAVLLDPKNYRSLANLASVLLDRGEIDDAIKKSDDALALNAASVHAHAIRGQAYVVKHQGLKDGRDTAEGRRLLKEAHSSLEKARPYFPAESEQGKLLADDWKYVQRSLRQ
jgi:tetratricopeptide (TPR) repeat protein